MPLLGVHNEEGRATGRLASGHDRGFETEEDEKFEFCPHIGSLLRIVSRWCTFFSLTRDTRVRTPQHDVVTPDSSKQQASISWLPRKRVEDNGKLKYCCFKCKFKSPISSIIDWHEENYAQTSRHRSDSYYVTGKKWTRNQASSHSPGTTLAEHEFDSGSSGKSSESYENDSQSTSIGYTQTAINVEITTVITTQPYVNNMHRLLASDTQLPPTPPPSPTKSIHDQ